MITIRFQLGGTFCVENYLLSYKKKHEYGVTDIDPDKLSRIELEGFLEEKGIKDVKELWYCKEGFSLNDGLEEIITDKDILELIDNVGEKRDIEVYVLKGRQQSPRPLLLGQAKVMGKWKTSSSIPSQSPKRKGKPPKETSKRSSQLHNSKRNLQKKPLNLRKKPPKEAPSCTTLIPYPPNPVLEEPLEVVDDVDECEEHDEDVDGSDSSDLGEDRFPDPFEECSDDEVPQADNSKGEEVTVETSRKGGVKGYTSKDQEDALTADRSKAHLEEDTFDIRVEDEDYGSSETGDDRFDKPRYPVFNPLVDFNSKISLRSGMKFGSNIIFRKALRQFAIENGFEFYFLHNDGTRVSAYCSKKCKCPLKKGRKVCIPGCKDNFCGFKAKGRKMSRDGTFQMKSFVPKHACQWQQNNSKVTSAWLAEKYIERYRDDPQWRIKAFISTVRREYNVHISYHKAWRARVRAILQTQGYAPHQYAKVYEYAAEVMKRNPGSSLFIRPELGPEKPIFQRFYVCSDACKKGFLAGIRPVVGIDGCHLKGAYTGQVLTAVAVDGNQHIFPIAFAVVEAERKETWVWFLEILMQDIGGKPITFMSDRQKGLMEAISIVAPQADTRVCVRHLHNNFKVKWCGSTYKDAVWAAARSATKAGFEANMALIKDMDPEAEAWLRRSNPETWSLHGFKHYAKSDMLLNNACESFNSCILEARELPILSMCEWIRRKLMKLFINKRNKMAAHQGLFTPEAATVLNNNMILSAGSCQCFGEGLKFEVDCKGKTYVVDLDLRSCGCNMWELTGIPCAHAICCIVKNRLDVNDYVSSYYYTHTFMKAYALNVNPMPGEDQWEKTADTPLLPPKLVVQPGRPRKSRKKDKGEKSDTKKATRVRHGKNKCSNCHEEGHIKKTCKNPSRPPPPKPAPGKRGRPPTGNTMNLPQLKRKYVRKVKPMYDPNCGSSSQAQQMPSEAMPSQDVHSLDDISDDAMIEHMVEMEQASDNPIATQFRATSSMVFPITAPTSSSQLSQLSSNPVRRSQRAHARK